MGKMTSVSEGFKYRNRTGYEQLTHPVRSAAPEAPPVRAWKRTQWPIICTPVSYDDRPDMYDSIRTLVRSLAPQTRRCIPFKYSLRKLSDTHPPHTSRPHLAVLTSRCPLPQLLQRLARNHHLYRADRTKCPGYSHISSKAQQSVSVVWF